MSVTRVIVSREAHRCEALLLLDFFSLSLLSPFTSSPSPSPFVPFPLKSSGTRLDTSVADTFPRGSLVIRDTINSHVGSTTCRDKRSRSSRAMATFRLPFPFSLTTCPIERSIDRIDRIVRFPDKSKPAGNMHANEKNEHVAGESSKCAIL